MVIGSNLGTLIPTQIISCHLAGGTFDIKSINKETNNDVINKIMKTGLLSHSVNGAKSASKGVNKHAHKTHCEEMNNWYTHNRFAPLIDSSCVDSIDHVDSIEQDVLGNNTSTLKSKTSKAKYTS